MLRKDSENQCSKSHKILTYVLNIKYDGWIDNRRSMDGWIEGWIYRYR